MRPDCLTIRAPLPEWSWTAATSIFTDASVLSRSRWHAMAPGVGEFPATTPSRQSLRRIYAKGQEDRLQFSA